MPTTYEKCEQDSEAVQLMNTVLTRHECYQTALNARVKFDVLFACAPRDDEGRLIQGACAMKDKGHRILGKARIITLKDRAAGRADGEICLDKEWWDDASDEQREALLDHELFHFIVRTNKAGAVIRDDLSRPVLKLRHHDVQVGWFSVVAKRNGMHSQEQIHAKWIMDEFGQAFWPDLVKVK